MILNTQVSSLGFVYKAKKKPLEKIGILTLKDLLYYAPVRYEQYPDPKPIKNTLPNEDAVVEGKVATIKNQYLRNRKSIQKAVIWDDSGELECVWFNQIYLVKVIKEGDTIRAAGKIKYSGNKKSISVKDYEVIIPDKKPLHIAHIVPIYSETRGLSSKWIRNRIFERLNSEIEYRDIIPEEYLTKHNLSKLEDAVRTIHFPENLSLVEKARFRFSYEEILLKRLASLKIKEEWNKKLTAHKFEIEKHRKKIDNLIKSLPFELTNSQKTAIESIFKDFQKDKPMNRLLEGDVGSGKTIVAAISAYLAYLNGFQVAFMAPTGILAQQHYKTFEDLLSPLGIKIGLITSNTRKSELNTQFSIFIGTHALIHKKANFKKLGLVIIDEQQRFGVEQRAILRERGDAPHVLTMTATPIPRTILLTAYGDLDVSLLDEMPKGRKNIKTWLVPNEKRENGYKWIKEKIKKGDQVFIVCPFIEASETLTTIKAATEEFERLKKEIFKDFKLGLLHGKLKADEKNAVLSDFKNKKFDILVSTPVVEVGIDIPNATIMLIEASERFGLAQLHQMRGRVGRGEKESYCLLYSENLNPTTERRLRSLEKIFSGPQLSEIDLQLRGPGNIYGTAQHGRVEFKFASIFDRSLISLVQKDAVELIKELDKHKLLRDEVESTIIQKVSPD
jgi:ATP-dependent DNA helicase RecG